MLDRRGFVNLAREVRIVEYRFDLREVAAFVLPYEENPLVEVERAESRVRESVLRGGR